jgi:putative cell wall-binding protein
MLRRSTFRLTLACVLALVLVPAAPALAAMSRSVVMQRAQRWVDLAIPYSQTGWADLNGAIVGSPSMGWRRDCSGFTSMAWNLFKPGASTRTLHLYAEAIDKAALQPGDALVSYDNHAVIFGGWADSAHTRYYAYEMSSSASRTSTPTPDGTIMRVTPYPYWGNDASYQPYRLKGITENIDYTAYTVSIEGPDRYATALAASRAAFADGEATAAVVASGENWPDALGASALAGALGGPVLLTRSDRLPAEVGSEIRRLGVREVVVVGGPAAVERSVVEAIDRLAGVSVTRIGGRDRFETARRLAAETAARVRAAGGALDGTVFVATGANFPDALAASPVAYAMRRPIVLTAPDRLSADAEAALAAVEATCAVVLGGPASVSADAATRLAELLGTDAVRRLAGSDRYATGYAIALWAHDECGLAFAGAGIATGAAFPDALAGGAMAGRLGTVMLLTPPTRLDGRIADLMLANRAEFAKPHCLGGTKAVTPIVRESIACMLSEP